MTRSAGDRFGACEILGVVGAGGIGVVYRALDTRLRREVALKLLPDVADGDATSRARLMHEARAAAALNHPGICTIHEVGDVDGTPYIAMELIDGETLQSMVRRRPMSPDRVCRKSLFLTALRDGERMLLSPADDGTHERRLTSFSGRRGSMGNIATDGTYLYFTWDEDIGDLWIMDVVAGK